MKKRISLITLVLSIIISFLHIYIYKWDNERVIDIGEIGDFESNYGYYDYYVDEFKIDNGSIVAEAWVIKKGEDVSYCDRRIVLISKNNRHVYGVNTVMRNRDEVTEYYHDGHYYSHSGIHALVNKSEIEKITEDKNFIMGVVIGEEDLQKRIIMTDKEITL